MEDIKNNERESPDLTPGISLSYLTDPLISQ